MKRQTHHVDDPHTVHCVASVPVRVHDAVAHVLTLASDLDRWADNLDALARAYPTWRPKSARLDLCTHEEEPDQFGNITPCRADFELTGRTVSADGLRAELADLHDRVAGYAARLRSLSAHVGAEALHRSTGDLDVFVMVPRA